MHIAIHLGAHCTDEDLLLDVLRRNAGNLAERGVAVPRPQRARPAIRKAAQATRGGPLDPAAAEALLTEMLGEDRPDRIVLSYEAFLGVYARVLEGGRLYGEAGPRAALLRQLFPGHALSFHLAIRNLATFVPAVFEASSVDTLDDFVGEADLAALRWTDPVRAIRAACPDVPLTIWCNEDLPLIFPQVLADLAGIDAPLPEGEDAFLEKVMTEAGLRRLRAYLRDNPPATRSTWRRVVTAFLGKYADPAAVEPEITTPGWSDAMVGALSAAYEDDVARLATLPNLAFLRP